MLDVLVDSPHTGAMTTPQPASRVYVTRKGAENHAAREQAYSDRQNDGLIWEAKQVEGGFQVFCTDPHSSHQH